MKHLLVVIGFLMLSACGKRVMSDTEKMESNFYSCVIQAAPASAEAVKACLESAEYLSKPKERNLLHDQINTTNPSR